MSHHRVRIHKWHQGRATTQDHQFASIDEARRFALREGYEYKIYNHQDELVEDSSPADSNTYA